MEERRLRSSERKREGETKTERDRKEEIKKHVGKEQRNTKTNSDL
jgi:hypothetical protein